MRTGPLFGIALFAGASLCCAVAMPAPAISLAGTWSPVGSDCTVTDGAIRISGKTLVADEVVCRFETLRPSHPNAMMTGQCQYLGEGSTSTVAVRTVGRHITLAYDGGAAVEYRRCSKH